MGRSPSTNPPAAGPERDGHRLARLAQETIGEALGGPRAERPAGPWFDAPGATFVTLTLDGDLRGCMGGTEAHPSLAEGVQEHARAAAFLDPRFPPLRAADLSRLGVEVSVLSPLEPRACATEAELLAGLRPGVDGLVLAEGGTSVTFLPQVWSGLPEPAAFLAALRRKTGRPARAWSAAARAWAYTVEAWREEPPPPPPAGPLGAGFLFPGRHWHRLSDGRFRCEVCPQGCALREGQTGRCGLRRRVGDHMMAAYGRTSGFCVDPIEKKPLHHFLPGSSVLSLGTEGCSLSCRFCQNWELSQGRGRLSESAAPDEVADLACRLGCPSVAFTYNEPSTALEFVSDAARACHDRGVAAVAVTSGFLEPAARRDFFAHLDAANVDLKAFSDGFYRDLAGGRLQPVLDTLRHLIHETGVWTEITTLLIPGCNDAEDETRQLAAWIADDLGPEVPLHFTAFHPAHRLLDRPTTPAATLRRARSLALEAGLKHVYLGNLPDPEGSTTFCGGCGRALIRREGYRVLDLAPGGRCGACGEALPGRFGNAYFGAKTVRP